MFAEAKRRKALTKEQRDAEDAAKKAAEEAAKKAEEEIVLVEQEVELRGNGSTAPEGTKVRNDRSLSVCGAATACSLWAWCPSCYGCGDLPRIWRDLLLLLTAAAAMLQSQVPLHGAPHATAAAS
jgi:hypothetical protein